MSDEPIRGVASLLIPTLMGAVVGLVAGWPSGWWAALLGMWGGGFLGLALACAVMEWDRRR